MRITRTNLRFPSRLLGLLAIGALCTVAPEAHAQSFPADATWTVLLRSSGIVADGNDATGNKDAFGDATTTNAAIRIHSDQNFLYFRMRVNGNPIVSGNYDSTSAWSCAIDTNKTAASYEFMATLDGGGADTVQWRQNTNASDAMSDFAENPVGSFSAATHARNVNQAGSVYFVDWAIPWTTINGSGVAKGIPMRFACGTSVSGAFTIQHDPISTQANASATFTGTMSDYYVCDNSGCARDGDGDSVPDTVETALGTDPTEADTDGDGIPDNIELTPPGGGAFTLVNSDSDLIIDALDTDSDNDCVPDMVEGVAGYRNANVPNGNPSANCPAAQPVCVQSTGTCAACTTNFGGGVTGCPTAVKPQCNTTGPLQGQCTQCKEGATLLCSGATPACESSNGTCTACNGDFGSGASARCVQASLPACQPAGAPNNLPGRCTQCSQTSFALCTGTATPVCEPASGQCAKCNADNGGVGTLKCPTTADPTCVLVGGADFGKCIKCTSNADCGQGHAGPTCEIATGKCIDTDTDGDGLNDSVELTLGTDPTKADTDGDGISDYEEVVKSDGTFEAIDSDKDGIIDAKDTDSDNDGIPDAEEAVRVPLADAGTDAGIDAGAGLVFRDTDGDGLPDWRDPDDDNDAILTKDEIADTKLAKVDEDVDGDGLKNWYDTDSDGDGVTDAVEGRNDNDSDGIPNYLDKTNGGGPTEAGPVIPPGAEGVINEADSGAPPDPPAAPDDGSLEGSSLCSATNGPASPFVLVVVSGIFLVALRRRVGRRARR